MGDAAQPILFRCAPVHRRILWSGVVSLVLFSGLVAWLIASGIYHPSSATVLMPMVLMSTLPILALGWMNARCHVLIDAYSLTIYRGRKPERWPWELFEKGNLKRPHHGRWFIDDTSGHRARRLQFSFLSREDREVVQQICEDAWQSPAPPRLPETISFNITFKGKVLMDATGITRTSRTGESKLLWPEVQAARIRRWSHKRQDFRLLEIVHPTLSVKLWIGNNEGSEASNWTGESPETIAAFVLAHVPPDRLHISTTDGPPRTLDDVDDRLQMLSEKVRAGLIAGIFFGGLVGVMWVLLLIILFVTHAGSSRSQPHLVVALVVFCCMMTALAVAIGLHERREVGRQRALLNEQTRQLETSLHRTM